MLIAENHLKEKVSLFEFNKSQCEELRGAVFTCCSCGEKVILKNGLKNQSHFAHKNRSYCQAFSEGETEEHLLGKKLLGKWCQQEQLNYQLEAYLPELKQRPDLLVESNKVIEFQCSPLPYKRFLERTENYLKANYQVTWLLGKAFFLKKKLTSFQHGCLKSTENGQLYLQELVVSQQKIRQYLNVEVGLLNSQVNFQKVHFGTSYQFLEDLQKPDFSLSKESWQEGIFKDLEYRLHKRDPQIMELQGALYRFGLNIRLLPTSLFLPQWQSPWAKHELIIRVFIWQLLKKYEGKRMVYHRLEKIILKRWLQLMRDDQYLPLVKVETVLKKQIRRFIETQGQLGYLILANGQFYINRQPELFNSQNKREKELENYREKLSIFKQ